MGVVGRGRGSDGVGSIRACWSTGRWGSRDRPGKLLQPLGDMPAMSAPECYRFELADPMVDTVLCGARSFEELAASAKGVAEGPLGEPCLTEVRRFGGAVRATFTGKVGWAGT